MFQYLIPFGVLAAVAFFSTGNKLLDLQLGIASLRYKKASLTKLTFITDLEAYNPNKKKLITINSFDFDLIYKKKKIAKIVRDNLNIQVKPLTKSNLKGITVDVSTLDVISELLSLLLNDGEKTMIVSGILKADGLTYPINETIQLTQE